MSDAGSGDQHINQDFSMRLAVQDSRPDQTGSAEKDFIERFLTACSVIGVESRSVATSDEVITYAPDAVLVLSKSSDKLTGIPTIGMISVPSSLLKDDPHWAKSLMSYDGYLVGSDESRTYLQDLRAGLSGHKPIAVGLFLPTMLRTPFNYLEQMEEASLCCVDADLVATGHRGLFDILTDRKLLTCYGAEQHGRSRLEAAENSSVLEAIGRHGMVLCPQDAEYRVENIPPLSLFAALSVGALAICDDTLFARRHLSEVASLVDMTQSDYKVADEIEALLNDFRQNLDAARARARRAKAWFDERWSLEVQIQDTIIPFVEQVVQVGRFRRAVVAGRPAPMATSAPKCEVVIRSGCRDLSRLRRAIGSVKAANSREFPLGVILVDQYGLANFETVRDELASADFPIVHARSAADGFRSKALWNGLRSATAPFVAHLDEHDSVFENHYRQLSTAFAVNPHVDVCYSGVVRVNHENAIYENAQDYHGSQKQAIKERRELAFLDAFDLDRLAGFDNYIHSNAWMGKTDFVQAALADDPELLAFEDVYLLLLLAASGPFGFTGSPTAQWHRRSDVDDDPTAPVDPLVRAREINRAKLRLAHVPFRSTTTFARLIASPTSEAVAVDRRRPDTLPSLNFNSALEGGEALMANAILTGFHAPEAGGIWSGEAVATVLMSLSHRVREEGGSLLVECLGAVADMPNRWLDLAIGDGHARRIPIADWSVKTVALSLPPGSPSPLTLTFTSSHLAVPDANASETRALGGFIRSIRVMTEQDALHLAMSRAVRSVPMMNGYTQADLNPGAGEAIQLRAPGAGRLFLREDRAIRAAASSVDGHFVIPAELADRARSWVFVSSDAATETGEVRVGLVEDGRETDWLTLRDDTVASFQDYRVAGDAREQHIAARLDARLLPDGGTASLRLSLSNLNSVGEWKAWAAEGSAWDVLANLGEEAADRRGLCRHGALSTFAALIAGRLVDHPCAPLRAGGAFVASAILAGAVDGLATARAEAPPAFLLWLVNTLMTV